MSVPASVSKEKVRAIIVAVLPPATNPEGVIFGVDGALDSLALVGFLADLEYRLSEEFGGRYMLASDQAMSRSRSPFRDVDSLTAYISELLAR